MAELYDLQTGYTITEGLQGSSVCDEAIIIARSEARQRGRIVLLDDDDGQWLVGPRSTRRLTPSLAKKRGLEWAIRS